MSSNKILLVFVAVTCLVVACSAAPAESQSAEYCVSALEKRLANVEVPNEMDMIIAELRNIDINPSESNHKSINSLLDLAVVDGRLEKYGLNHDKELDQLNDACSSYTRDEIMPALLETCDFTKFFESDESYMEYTRAMEQHPDVDLKIGASRICFRVR